MRAGQKIVVADLARLIDQGLSTAQIAAHFGVQSPAVTRMCRSNSLSLPMGRVARSGKNKTWTRADDERDLKILRMIRNGWPQQDLAKRLRIGIGTIQSVLREIEAADRKESGEPPEDIAPFYKRRKLRVGK